MEEKHLREKQCTNHMLMEILKIPGINFNHFVFKKEYALYKPADYVKLLAQHTW